MFEASMTEVVIGEVGMRGAARTKSYAIVPRAGQFNFEGAFDARIRNTLSRR
jgi:hypothetical protein